MVSPDIQGVEAFLGEKWTNICGIKKLFHLPVLLLCLNHPGLLQWFFYGYPPCSTFPDKLEGTGCLTQDVAIYPREFNSFGARTKDDFTWVPKKGPCVDSEFVGGAKFYQKVGCTALSSNVLQNIPAKMVCFLHSVKSCWFYGHQRAVAFFRPMPISGTTFDNWPTTRLPSLFPSMLHQEHLNTWSETNSVTKTNFLAWEKWSWFPGGYQGGYQSQRKGQKGLGDYWLADSKQQIGGYKPVYYLRPNEPLILAVVDRGALGHGAWTPQDLCF